MKLEPQDELFKSEQSMWAQIVARSEWIAHTLCEIPFEKEDDVLTMIHQINRQLSLSAESTLQVELASICLTYRACTNPPSP